VFSLYVGDANAEAALDLSDRLGLSEAAGLIEVPQVGPQLVEKFSGAAVAHRETILHRIGANEANSLADQSSSNSLIWRSDLNALARMRRSC
jgi:hypothetical protein